MNINVGTEDGPNMIIGWNPGDEFRIFMYILLRRTGRNSIDIPRSLTPASILGQRKLLMVGSSTERERAVVRLSVHKMRHRCLFGRPLDLEQEAEPQLGAQSLLQGPSHALGVARWTCILQVPRKCQVDHYSGIQESAFQSEVIL